MFDNRPIHTNIKTNEAKHEYSKRINLPCGELL